MKNNLSRKEINEIVDRLEKSPKELKEFIKGKKHKIGEMSDPDEIIKFYKKTRDILNRGVFFKECEELDAFVVRSIKNDVKLTFEQQMALDFNQVLGSDQAKVLVLKD